MRSPLDPAAPTATHRATRQAASWTDPVPSWWYATVPEPPTTPPGAHQPCGLRAAPYSHHPDSYESSIPPRELTHEPRPQPAVHVHAVQPDRATASDPIGTQPPRPNRSRDRRHRQPRVGRNIGTGHPWRGFVVLGNHQYDPVSSTNTRSTNRARNPDTLRPSRRAALRIASAVSGRTRKPTTTFLGDVLLLTPATMLKAYRRVNRRP